MLFYVITGLINGIISTLLGVLVYFKDQREVINKAFVRFCLAVAIWSYGYFVWQISSTPEQAIFWSRVLMMGSIFIPITFFHFVITFLNIFQREKKVLIFGYFLTILFFISNFTSLFVNRVEPALSFPFWPKPGPVFHLFHLMFVSYAFYFWYLLFRHQQKETGIRKIQIRYILLGSLIGFLGGATNHFLWYNISIPPLGNFLPAVGFCLTAFAILKYHLFEIRVILTEMLVGAMGLLWLIFFFLMPTLQLKGLAFLAFLLFLIFAHYLLKATHEEERRREEAERIAIQERALREKSEKLAREFEKLARAKDQFLLSIQHHLRTPLTPIRGYAEMILEGTYGKEENPKIKEKLLSIKKSADTLHNLMESLLDIQALRMGKEILNLEKCQLTDLIEEVIEELKPQAKEKGIPLYFEKDSLPEMKLDKKRIKEVIWNLIDNAIKHTNKGKVNIKVQNLKSKVLLMVSDTGIGMTEEEREYFLLGKLFERGVEAKKLFGPGRGVGLAISIEFVKAHGGKIWVESEGRGKGTTFYVELPINQKDEEDNSSKN